MRPGGDYALRVCLLLVESTCKYVPTYFTYLTLSGNTVIHVLLNNPVPLAGFVPGEGRA